MKTSKIIALVFGLVLLIGGGAVYYLLSNLDQIVEGVIEKVGTEMTGTQVSLDGVSIDLRAGRGELRGLVLANPPGYSTDYALKFSKVAVAIDPASLAGQVITLSEITVKGGELNAEQTATGNNLKDILDEVERQTASEPKESEAPAPSSEPTDVRLYLKRFVLAGTQATVIVPEQKPAVINVPDVRRKNIGSPDKGLTPEQLGSRLLSALLEEVQDAVAKHLASLAIDAAKDKVSEKLGLDKLMKKKK
ncbi:MAG: hypothetical protein AAGI11_18210 [Pseudomonadota bacterium]